MADAISLMNLTTVSDYSFDQFTARMNSWMNFFKALGGIFILGLIAWIISIRNIVKQRKEIQAINKKLDKLIKKRR